MTAAADILFETVVLVPGMPQFAERFRIKSRNDLVRADDQGGVSD
jgi:hypothetical protein